MTTFAKADPRIPVSRADGRPEAYDAPPGTRAQCVLCALEKKAILYKEGEIVMTSPLDADDGAAHMVCLGHLPENIVIYDPASNKCRNRDGSHVWEEATGSEPIPYIPPNDAKKATVQ